MAFEVRDALVGEPPAGRMRRPWGCAGRSWPARCRTASTCCPTAAASSTYLLAQGVPYHEVMQAGLAAYRLPHPTTCITLSGGQGGPGFLRSPAGRRLRLIRRIEDAWGKYPGWFDTLPPSRAGRAAGGTAQRRRRRPTGPATQVDRPRGQALRQSGPAGLAAPGGADGDLQRRQGQRGDRRHAGAACCVGRWSKRGRGVLAAAWRKRTDEALVGGRRRRGR